MRTSAYCLVLSALLTLSLSACTTKATFKSTSDSMYNFLSSTSGQTWFTEEGLVKEGYKAEAFAAINFENLQEEMAAGRGEYLASLGRLLGVPEKRLPEFYALAQERYSAFFSSEQITPREMLVALSRETAAIRR